MLGPLASLMSVVLYRVVSPWRLSLTLWVVVAEVALSVAVSVMPVVRSLLWFTASLMLLMLLLVGVGLCVGGQWPVFWVGHRLVSVALSGRVCSRWCGLLVMLLVRGVQAMPRVVSWVRVVLVAPVVLVLLVTAWWMAPCGCFGGEGLVVDGSGCVPSPPLARAWWFVGSPVVVALASSGGGGAQWWGDAGDGVFDAVGLGDVGAVTGVGVRRFRRGCYVGLIVGGVAVSDGVDAGGGGSGCGSVGGAGAVVGQCWVASCVGLWLVRVS